MKLQAEWDIRREIAADVQQEIIEAPITLRQHELANRTFLLGDGGGFVLYLPVELNTRDETLLPIKWFGASELGRKYLEAIAVSVEVGGTWVQLNREAETGFTQYLDRAERTFQVQGITITQTFFVPIQARGFAMRLVADRALRFALEPEFDMRYYQQFNSSFAGYTAGVIHTDQGEALQVSNSIHEKPPVGTMQFYACVRSADGPLRVDLFPTGRRLRHKTYLQDERRELLIKKAYSETHQQVPDEAPLWDVYGTEVYVPARITGKLPNTVICTFSDVENEVAPAAERIAQTLPSLETAKVDTIRSWLLQGALETGHTEVDRVYAQMLARFNDCLVARNVTVRSSAGTMEHFYGIFAGNKYFLDAWKRDENISLEALLATSDYATVRAILNETWQYQDPRTGRLPHIIRLGEPLVYYSSDGTLWALHRLYQYTRRSGDTSLLEEKYTLVEHFFAASLGFISRGLLPSGGIVDKTYLWETWEDTPFTPRAGYPVEIELLWLTALRHYVPIVAERNPELAEHMKRALQDGEKTFQLFYMDGYLADFLDYDFKPNTNLTPNGYIAFGLDFPLPDSIRCGMVQLGREQLAGRCGIRSLAPRDWENILASAFLADRKNNRDHNLSSIGLYNYHRGIEWQWFTPFFVQAELNYGSTDRAFQTYMACQLHDAVHVAGVAGLSELVDRNGPLGADFQTWSMAGFLASLHEFTGVRGDAVEKTVRIRPSIPQSWPHIATHHQIGKVSLDMAYHHTGQTQRVDIAASPEGTGYRAHIGVRIPKGATVSHVSCNGASLAQAAAQLVANPCGDGEDEVFVDVPMQPDLHVEFTVRQSHGSSDRGVTV